MTSQPRNSEPTPKRRGRILCVTSNFPRWKGDSTTPFVLHLAQDLQQLGWTVDVLAPHAEADTASREYLEGVHVERFHYLWPRTLQTVCYHGGALVNLRSNRSNFLKLPALVLCQWIAILWRLMLRRYDVVHSHWVLPQGFTGTLASGLFGVPHVITIHGGDVFALRGKVSEAFKRFSLKRADVVTVNSSVTQHAVNLLEPSLKKLRVIPMGVDVDGSREVEIAQIQQIRQRYCTDGGSLLVFIGRVVAEKGVEDFIQAVEILLQSGIAVSALIIGEGQHRQRFTEMVDSRALSRSIHFTGWVDSSSIYGFFKAADVFVGPSRRADDGWVEAQGLTFLEAMAAGIPVVATRCGGIIDSVEDGVTGLLVDERSPQQIAAAVNRILGDSELRDLLTQNAELRVRERFSRQSSAESFCRAISEACGTAYVSAKKEEHAP